MAKADIGTADESLFGLAAISTDDEVHPRPYSINYATTAFLDPTQLAAMRANLESRDPPKVKRGLSVGSVTSASSLDSKGNRKLRMDSGNAVIQKTQKRRPTSGGTEHFVLHTPTASHGEHTPRDRSDRRDVPPNMPTKSLGQEPSDSGRSRTSRREEVVVRGDGRKPLQKRDNIR